MHDERSSGSSRSPYSGGGGGGSGGGRGPRGGHDGREGRDGRGGGGGGGGGGRGRHEPDHEGRGLPLSELDPALTEVSRRLIGCAIEVHKAIGPGYDRSVYFKAIEAEMNHVGLTYKVNHAYPLMYRGQHVGQCVADLVVGDRFVVSLLALRGEVGSSERTGLRALLRAADMELGLIINFAERRLKDGLVRVLNPDKLNLNRAEGEHEGGAGSEHGGDTHSDENPGV